MFVECTFWALHVKPATRERHKSSKPQSTLFDFIHSPNAPTAPSGREDRLTSFGENNRYETRHAASAILLNDA